MDAANDLDKTGDLDRGTSADLVDEEDGVLGDAETSKTVDVATDAAADIDVVLAALGAVGDTVVDLAVTEAEHAGEALDEVDNGVGETAGDATGADSVSVLLGVEEGDGVDGALEVETGETSAGALEVGAHLALDVDGLAGVETDLSIDGERGDEDGVLEAGLAVGVLGVVLDDLVRRSSAVSAELDINTSVGVDVGAGLGVAASGLLAGALLGSAVPGLAGRARAGLCPGAVGHGAGAREAGAGLEGGGRVGADGEVAGGDAGGGVEDGIRSGDGRSHRGHRGQGDDEVGEVHLGGLLL